MKFLLFIATVATIMLGSQFLAAQYAQPQPQLTPQQEAWMQCVDKHTMKWLTEIANSKEKQAELDKDMCLFIGADTPEECEIKQQGLKELGMLQAEVRRYLMEKLIVPACGQPPR